MNIRATITAAVIAVIGVAVVIYLESTNAARSTSSDDRGPLLRARDLPLDELTRITVERRGDDPLVFDATHGGWRQVEPFNHPVDPHSIRQLAVQALSIERADVLTADDFDAAEWSPRALSLDPPDGRVIYEWPGGTLTLHLGRRGIAGRAYLRIDDDERIYVVGHELHDRALDMDPSEWRQRRLFPDAGAQTERISTDLEGWNFAIEREHRRWRMTEPVNARVDRDALEEYMDAITRASASGFMAEQPDRLDRFGLDQPVATFTIESSEVRDVDGEPQRAARTSTLRIGNRIGMGGEDYFAMVEGRDVVIRVSQAVLNALFQNPGALIDLTASGARPADVKRLRIAGPDGDFTLERDRDQWIAPDHGDRVVDTEIVEQLLESLTAVRATELRIDAFRRDAEVGFVTFFAFDERPADTVRIARDPSSGQWELDNGEGVQRIFPEHLALPIRPSDYGLPAASNGRPGEDPGPSADD